MSYEEEVFDRLVAQGALKFSGIDSETGEALYIKTDTLKFIDPKLDKELSFYFSEITLKLWEKGFVDMDVTESDPIVKLSKKSLNPLSVRSLEKNERIVLEEMIRVLFKKN